MAEQFPVYGGRATVTFHPGRHYYTVSVPGLVDKLYQPGVTTILKMKDKSTPLMIWATRQMTARVEQLFEGLTALPTKRELRSLLKSAEETYRDVVQEAADIGSLVHRVLEQALLGNFSADQLPLTANLLLAPDLSSDMVDLANNAIAAGLVFFGQHTIKVLETEQPRWSPTWGYIGTGDVIADVDGVLTILDFKTSKAIYNEYFIQTAAYQMAYQEEHPEQQIQQRWIIGVGKDGRLHEATRDNSTLADDFLAFRALRKIWEWDRLNDTYARYPSKPVQVIGNLDAALAALPKE